MLADRPLVTFPLLALASFLVAIVGFNVVARIAISNETFQFALTDSAVSIFRWPALSIWLAGPFALMVMVAWWADSVVSARAARTLYLVAAVIFGLIYFVGMWDAQRALADHGQNAAEVKLIVLPFICAPIVLIAAAIVVVAAWRKRGREA